MPSCFKERDGLVIHKIDFSHFLYGR
jgi:hypothetical protein